MSRPNVRIAGPHSLKYTAAASELEQTTPLAVLFLGGIFTAAVFLHWVPDEINGYFFSGGLALTFYGTYYMLRFPAGRRLKRVP